MRFAPAALALAAFVSARGLKGQSVTPLDPGTRIRVTTAASPRQIGRLLAISDDSLRFVPAAHPGDILGIALPQITRLDVSTGEHRHWRKGAGLGLLIGAATGAIVAGITYGSCESGCWFSRDEVTAGGAIMAGLAGAVVGTLIGGLHPTEGWAPVVPPEPVRVGAVPLPNRRVALAVSVAF